MADERHCANCKSVLPADHPKDNRYCAKCTAAWTKGPSPK